MFNSTTYKHETTVTPVTRIVEKSITPDKVTEMYDKVREEVERNFVQMIKIESNTLNGVVVEFTDQFDTNTRKYYTRFVLNGDEHTDKRSISKEQMLTQQEAFGLLKEHYTNVVSNNLLKEYAAKVSRKDTL
jgi:hypothetical protein